MGLLLSFTSTAAQSIPHPDISILRGTWEYRSHYELWKFDFISDSDVIFNRWDARYVLLPGILRVIDRAESTDYIYRLRNNILTLRTPEGSEIDLSHKAAGEIESKLTGTYRTEPDPSNFSLGVRFFSEYGLSAFELRVQDTVVYGMFRVIGRRLVLEFEDGFVDTAWIGYAADRHVIEEMYYHDRILTAEREPDPPDPPEEPQSIPIIIVWGDPAPPPPEPCPPHPTPPTPAPPGAAVLSPARNPTPTIREFGSTRTANRR